MIFDTVFWCKQV